MVEAPDELGKRVTFLVIGVGVFLLVNTALHLPRCLHIMDWGYPDLCDSTTGAYTPFVLDTALERPWPHIAIVSVSAAKAPTLPGDDGR